MALFHDGRFGLRLPAILGFWTLCVCLFRFTGKRLGLLAGSIALLLPLLTGVFYYSYEARPHGSVLGFCGLALVCWQNALEPRWRRWWLAAFSLSLLAASMMHCYAVVLAVPFGLTEAYLTLRSRRFDWPAWFSLIIPVSVAALADFPLLRAYRSSTRGTNFDQVAPHGWDQILNFYVFLVSPFLLFLLAALALFALGLVRSSSVPQSSLPNTRKLTLAETLLSLFFLALPVFGVTIAKLLNGPFFARYFSAAVIGFGVLIVLVLDSPTGRQTARVIFLSLAVCTLACQFSWLLLLRHFGRPANMSEPSSGYSLNYSVSNPLERWALLMESATHSPEDEPIIIQEPLDFFYLVQYSPASIRARLRYLETGEQGRFFSHLFDLYRAYSPVPYHQTVTFEELWRAHPHALIFGQYYVQELAPFIRPGIDVRSVRVANGRYLAELDASFRSTSE